VTHDEAAILYHLAVQTGMLALASCRRAHWLEIGCNAGWSTAHIASAPDVDVTALDQDRVAIDRAIWNVEACGLSSRVQFLCGASDDLHLLDLKGPIYDGVFIDGGHEPGQPERDARLVVPLLHDDAVVVLHDAIGKPVQDAIKYLIACGFKYQPYCTPQLLAVLYRGRFNPPHHEPDPTFNWSGWLVALPEDIRQPIR
jgi:predicted O-methyltransferase YrrM